MNALPFRIVTLLTGLVVAGEALALLVGTHFLSEDEHNSWPTAKNNPFLALDTDNSFCANAPLFVVTNLKIVDLLATVIPNASLALARKV